MPTRNIPVYNLLIIYQNLCMKKVSKVSTVFIIFLILSCIPSESTIIGKWTLHTHDDNEVIATLNNDGTYNAEGSTGEQEVSRKYLVTKDILAINDEGCNENIWGKYKLTFYEAVSAFSLTGFLLCFSCKISLLKILVCPTIRSRMSATI